MCDFLRCEVTRERAVQRRHPQMIKRVGGVLEADSRVVFLWL